MKVLKPGDDVTYVIGTKNLVLTPMPWGRLKKIFAMVSESASVISGDITSNPSQFMKWVSGLLEKKADEFLLMLFDKSKNDFISQGWIEDNLTLIDIQKIIWDAITINGVSDFLAKKGSAQAIMQEEPIPNKKKEPVAS